MNDDKYIIRRLNMYRFDENIFFVGTLYSSSEFFKPFYSRGSNKRRAAS